MNLNMGFVPGVKHIVAKEGIAGLYQGLPATIGKQATNQVPWALSLSFCLHTTLSLSHNTSVCVCVCVVQGIRFVTFNEYKKRILAYTGAVLLLVGVLLFAASPQLSMLTPATAQAPRSCLWAGPFWEACLQAAAAF